MVPPRKEGLRRVPNEWECTSKEQPVDSCDTVRTHYVTFFTQWKICTGSQEIDEVQLEAGQPESGTNRYAMHGKEISRIS